MELRRTISSSNIAVAVPGRVQCPGWRFKAHVTAELLDAANDIPPAQLGPVPCREDQPIGVRIGDVTTKRLRSSALKGMMMRTLLPFPSSRTSRLSKSRAPSSRQQAVVIARRIPTSWEVRALRGWLRLDGQNSGTGKGNQRQEQTRRSRAKYQATVSGGGMGSGAPASCTTSAGRGARRSLRTAAASPPGTRGEPTESKSAMRRNSAPFNWVNAGSSGARSVFLPS